MVRMKVAKSELTLAMPTFAKIAVRAAKAADRMAHACQELKTDFIMEFHQRAVARHAFPKEVGPANSFVGRGILPVEGNGHPQSFAALGPDIDLRLGIFLERFDD